MIVGVADIPSWLRDSLRDIESDKVYIYPEFFDAKRELLNGLSVARYISRIVQCRQRIIVAVWPDYRTVDRWGLCNLDIVWIYPLHQWQELYLLPRCIDFVGIPSDAGSRNYRLYEIYDEVRSLGYRLWLLGLRPSAAKLLRYYRFDGVDVTTLSIPKWQFSDNKKPEAARAFRIFVEELAENNVVLDKYELLKRVQQ